MGNLGLSHYRILIVEDSDVIIEELQNILQTLGVVGDNLIIAKDGIEGLKKVEEEIFDLVISDVIMPNCDGIEMLKKIRSKHPFFDTPFVYLTSEKDLTLVLDAIDLGVKNYLIKPINEKKVQDKILPILEDSIELSLQSLELVLEEYGYLKHIFHMVENSILILSPDNKIERSNMAFQNKVGLNHRKLRGQDFLENFVASEHTKNLQNEGEFKDIKMKFENSKTTQADILKFPLKDRRNKTIRHIVIIKEKKSA